MAKRFEPKKKNTGQKTFKMNQACIRDSIEPQAQYL